MIIDHISNAGRYFSLHNSFPAAFNFLQSELKDLPLTRHTIQNDDIFALLSAWQGKDKADAKLEYHRKYIDIQYVISGEEQMGWKYLESSTFQDDSFDDEHDIGFLPDVIPTWCDLSPGMFAIFFPEDAHAPMVASGVIHKAVIKVLI